MNQVKSNVTVHYRAGTAAIVEEFFVFASPYTVHSLSASCITCPTTCTNAATSGSPSRCRNLRVSQQPIISGLRASVWCNNHGSCQQAVGWSAGWQLYSGYHRNGTSKNVVTRMEGSLDEALGTAAQIFWGLASCMTSVAESKKFDLLKQKVPSHLATFGQNLLSKHAQLVPADRVANLAGIVKTYSADRAM